MAKKKNDVDVSDFVSSEDALEELDQEPLKQTPEEPDNPSKLKRADAVADGNIADAHVNDPPLRTNRPNVPVRSHLATGAGQHLPLNDPELDPDGRLRPDLTVEVAREQQEEADNS